MNNVFYQMSTSPNSLVDGNNKVLTNNRDRRNDYNSNDRYNEDTFGSGAVEEDWEFEHNQFVGLENPIEENKPFASSNAGINIPKPADPIHEDFGSVPLMSPSQLNEEELERSNQELAAAVEELVLNSDQDQDAIDPAIVSLRKQAPKPPLFGILHTASQLPPYYPNQDPKRFSNVDITTLLGKKPAEPTANGNLQNIWRENQQIPYAIDQLNGQHQTTNSNQRPLQDAAILSAIKSDQSTLRTSPLVLKAEDLERELQHGSSNRSQSPPFGISIPNSNNDHQTADRSLPARSVSPVFGSPSPSTMPIGTPPKHVILDMMHKLEQQQKEQGNSPRVTGASGVVTHPAMQPGPAVPHPGISVFLNRPPINGPRLTMSPSLPNMVWPARPPMPVTRDVINRLGLRIASPLNSPIGSPHAFPPMHPHLFATNLRMPPMPLHGVGRGAIRQPRPGMMGSPQRLKPVQKFGPGHLHPEHSKYVRMRQNHQFDRRGHNYQRNQNDGFVVGIPGDPYANIMTPKEKDWVIHIQMMALQSDRPEIDDYYYQNYIVRRLRDGKLNPNHSGKTPRRLITPSKPNAENRKYVPVQFNNSLGKLTTSSVYNPRQIIDIIQPPTNEDEAGESSSENRQALSKRLVVYQKIEKGYDLIVLIEEIHSTLAAWNGPNTERDLIEDDLKLKIKLLVDLLGFYDNPASDTLKDSIFQIMKIRKGKKLLTRAMPFLSLNDRVLAVLSIFSHLPILIKRDQKDGVLLELYPSISLAISLMSFDYFVEVLSKMTSFTLTAAIKDQVGASIVCKLLDRGRQLYAAGFTQGHMEWNKFVADVSSVIVSVANPKEGSRHARPSTPSLLLEVFSLDVFEVLAHHNDGQTSLDVLKSSFQRLITSAPSHPEASPLLDPQ